jgi:hypothetical protein
MAAMRRQNAMFPINPLSGALAQSAQIQIQQAAEKNQQARRASERAKNVAARDEDSDETEHPIENAEELTAIHDDTRQSQDQRKRNQHKEDDDQETDDDAGGLDLTA